MIDKYPRVSLRSGGVLDATGRWVGTPGGTHKVVPADAIVIERDALPEVMTCHERINPTAFSAGGGRHFILTNEDTPESLAADARALLALSEYLREHPPVDSALVQQIVDLALAADVTLTGTQVDAIARYFAATGRVHVDTEDGAR